TSTPAHPRVRCSDLTHTYPQLQRPRAKCSKSRRDQRRWPVESSLLLTEVVGQPASFVAIPVAIGQRITEQARRAFALRAMVAPLPAPIARDLVSPVSHHRWTVSIAQPRWGKRR